MILESENTDRQLPLDSNSEQPSTKDASEDEITVISTEDKLLEDTVRNEENSENIAIADSSTTQDPNPEKSPKNSSDVSEVAFIGETLSSDQNEQEKSPEVEPVEKSDEIDFTEDVSFDDLKNKTLESVGTDDDIVCLNENSDCSFVTEGKDPNVHSQLENQPMEEDSIVYDKTYESNVIVNYILSFVKDFQFILHHLSENNYSLSNISRF